MNRHMRRALEVKTRTQGGQTAAQRLKGVEALPEALRDMQAMLAGVNEMQGMLSQAVQTVAAMEYRLARQEAVFTQMLESIYTGLGTTFGARLNERVPYIEWRSRRLVLEAEYDKTHNKEAVPAEGSATET